MTVKTKKTKLEPSKYVSISFFSAIKEFWWVWFVPAAMLIIGAIFQPAFWWLFGIAITLSVLYILFWYIQFAGASQMDQNKILFQRMSYDIDSRQIIMKLNAKQGMPLGWDKVKAVKKAKDHLLFVISRGQFIYLPFTAFRNENDLRFVETIIKRKGLLKA